MLFSGESVKTAIRDTLHALGARLSRQATSSSRSLEYRLLVDGITAPSDEARETLSGELWRVGLLRDDGAGTRATGRLIRDAAGWLWVDVEPRASRSGGVCAPDALSRALVTALGEGRFRRHLDLSSGSGLVALAAQLGATEVCAVEPRPRHTLALMRTVGLSNASIRVDGLQVQDSVTLGSFDRVSGHVELDDLNVLPSLMLPGAYAGLGLRSADSKDVLDTLHHVFGARIWRGCWAQLEADAGVLLLRVDEAAGWREVSAGGGLSASMVRFFQ